MCGGLVVLAPGSALQIFAAILIMQFHLLVVLKLAPFVSDSEDWSAFLSTLGLCLISLGAYSLMLDLKGAELQLISTITIVLPILCIVSVLCIMTFVDCGLWNHLFKRRNKNQENATRVVPVAVNDVEHLHLEKLDDAGDDTKSSDKVPTLFRTQNQKK